MRRSCRRIIGRASEVKRPELLVVSLFGIPVVTVLADNLTRVMNTMGLKPPSAAMRT